MSVIQVGLVEFAAGCCYSLTADTGGAEDQSASVTLSADGSSHASGDDTCCPSAALTTVIASPAAVALSGRPADFTGCGSAADDTIWSDHLGWVPAVVGSMHGGAPLGGAVAVECAAVAGGRRHPTPSQLGRCVAGQGETPCPFAGSRRANTWAYHP
jgi:hypothetical protein